MDTAGFSAEWLARVCGVDLSTARRWKRLSFLPPRYRNLVRLADGADLGSLSPQWTGWRIYQDELVSPEGERFHVGGVRALRLKAQLAEELEHQLRRVLAGVPRPAARELVIRVRLDGDDIPAGPLEALALLEHLAPADFPPN